MDSPALERLGHYIVSLRVALGYRNRTDLADSLQLTVRTLSDVEHGVRKASPGTYAMLENKLAWTPGSIEIILARGEPNIKWSPQSTACRLPVSGILTAPDQPQRPLQVSTEELLLELRRRIIAPATDAPKPGTTATTHGGWPEQGE